MTKLQIRAIVKHLSVFVDDAVLLKDFLKVLVMALVVLQGKSDPLELKVSWGKAKVPSLGGVLDDTVLFVHAYGDDKNFKNVGSSRKSLNSMIWSALL